MASQSQSPAASSEKTPVTTIPISTHSISTGKRSEETLRPELGALAGKATIVEKPLAAPSLLPPSPRNSGILRQDKIPVSHTSSSSHVSRQLVINGVPLAGIMFLDIANSADFPANVFNETNPVPTFAVVLMAIGATFALVMSIVAFTDARRSWKAITILRQEQKDLRAKAASNQEKDVNPTLESFIHLNRRDLGTEFFERFGMEVFMGGAAFMIAVGTYMAIGGDDPKVFFASNLLSGYIGNTPAAFYGIINAAWSVVISFRARRQRKAATALIGSVHARRALIRRARLIQIHSAFSGVSCLVSGALGMVTPTQWEPYPALAVLGLLFMYTLYLFRTRISYVRSPLTQRTADVTTADLVEEIDQLLGLRNTILAKKSKDSKRQQSTYDRTTVEEQLRQITLCGLFEKACMELIGGGQRGKSSSPCTQMTRLIMDRQMTELTPADILKLADEMCNTADVEGSANANDLTFQTLGQWFEQLLRRKSVLRKISMRSRFLLELLGSHMISFPDDRHLYHKPA